MYDLSEPDSPPDNDSELTTEYRRIYLRDRRPLPRDIEDMSHLEVKQGDWLCVEVNMFKEELSLRTLHVYPQSDDFAHHSGVQTQIIDNADIIDSGHIEDDSDWCLLDERSTCECEPNHEWVNGALMVIHNAIATH